MKGRIRQAMHFALEAILQATTPDQTLRSWKLWLLLPRMLLHRPPGIRTISKPDWRLRITQFQEGEWTALLRHAAAANPPAAEGSTGQRRTLPETPNFEQRTRRARQLVHQGELSAARQALTAGPLAPSTAATLQELRDPDRRPPQPYQDFPQHLREFHPPAPPNIPPTQLLTNLRRARKGAAPGPSGFTAEVLRLVLDDDATTQHFVAVATSLAKAEVPHQVSQAIGLGRVVALQKPNGRVRGIVIGDLHRRLVSRSLAQTYASHFHTACMPHQFALSARTGTEAIVHALTAATEANPQHTILSVDGIGAYDTISRTSMLEGLRRVPDANSCLPFVRQFYAQPSTYVWHDSNGRPHPITQAEGGEQGDPLMPALFSLGQRGALEAVQANLEEGETLFAFLDDVYAVSPPHRVRAIYNQLAHHLETHTNIRLNSGKTRIWNAAGNLLGQRCRTQGRGKKEPTRSSSGVAAADSWCLESKPEDDGVKKLPCLLNFLPKQKHDKDLPSCKHPSQQPSSPAGPLCSVMLPCKHSRPACWPKIVPTIPMWRATNPPSAKCLPRHPSTPPAPAACHPPPKEIWLGLGLLQPPFHKPGD